MSSKNYNKTLEYLKEKNNILFLVTSNRWNDEVPKSSALAYKMQEQLGANKVTIIDVAKLYIVPCEGNVSQMGSGGNHCGTKDAKLKDDDKNPSGNHRCWASLNTEQVYLTANSELWEKMQMTKMNGSNGQ